MLNPFGRATFLFVQNVSCRDENRGLFTHNLLNCVLEKVCVIIETWAWSVFVSPMDLVNKRVNLNGMILSPHFGSHLEEIEVTFTQESFALTNDSTRDWSHRFELKVLSLDACSNCQWKKVHCSGQWGNGQVKQNFKLVTRVTGHEMTTRQVVIVYIITNLSDELK